jgi:hypothetical protein
MLFNYKRTNRLNWTDEQSKAFEDTKLAIHNSQTLTFLDGEGDVHLKTDASYYGMGTYLSQIRKGGEYPVAFLSKTLSKEQLKWKVPEKECYAIFWSFKKLEYLIRDIKFTLHTDHRNLTFLKTAGSDKILRWKLEIQGYNCRVIFIKGEDNMVADGFSRFGVTNFDEE